jgi:hypothetical protein
MIQDFIIAACQIAATISLIPTIINSKAKVPWTSSSITVTCLIIIGICFLSLNLLLSTITSFSNAIAWFFIFLFRRHAS